MGYHQRAIMILRKYRQRLLSILSLTRPLCFSLMRLTAQLQKKRYQKSVTVDPLLDVS